MHNPPKINLIWHAANVAGRWRGRRWEEEEEETDRKKEQVFRAEQEEDCGGEMLGYNWPRQTVASRDE